MAAHGLTYSKTIEAMKSTSYRDEARRYDMSLISPIKTARRAVFMDEKANVSYNLPGLLLLLHHAFMNRSLTKKVLVKRYVNLVSLGYRIIQ